MYSWYGGNYAPALFITMFGALLLVGLAALILSSFLMRRTAPVPRAAVTAGLALAIGLPLGLYLLPLGEARPWLTAGSSVAGAFVLFAILWRTFNEAWVPDHVAAAIDAEPYVFEPIEDAEPWELRNFLLRHWRGDLSLPVSYFLNGAIIAWAAGFVLALAVRSVEGSEVSLQTVAMLSLLYLVAVLLIWVWSTVGVWRSSGRHADRGGSEGWAVVAKVMVIIGVFGMFAQTRSYFLQVREFGMLAAGMDPLGDPARIELAGGGRTIAIRGNLTSGTADRFRDLLEQTPRAREVELTSAGGRMLEGDRIARLVRRHRLDTRVEEYCESACTFILLAGTHRLASPHARVGFHQPYFPGQNEAQRRYAIAAARRDYREAGMSGEFLDQALSALPDEMWYPSHEALIEANVVTSSEYVVRAPTPESRAADRAAMVRRLAGLARQANARRGMRLDRITTLEAATAEDDLLTYRLRLALDGRNVDRAQARRSAGAEIRRQLCDDPRAAEAIRRGAQFDYDFRDRRGARLFRLSVTSCA